MYVLKTIYFHLKIDEDDSETLFVWKEKSVSLLLPDKSVVIEVTNTGVSYMKVVIL